MEHNHFQGDSAARDDAYYATVMLNDMYNASARDSYRGDGYGSRNGASPQVGKEQTERGGWSVSGTDKPA